jgi:hypothetical protein
LVSELPPEEAVQSSASQSDPLVENGLGSPLCSGSAGNQLSARAKRNCSGSSFVAAPTPTSNYGVDVNIDAGLFGISSATFLSIVQDLFVTPVWNTLVWAVHALLVMLEWCYTLDLLGSSSLAPVTRILREVQGTFTQPWLALVLAVSSTLALYNGLVRRRIAETLGQALLTTAMMAAGLWVILAPGATVGAVGDWANQASLGTLSVFADGVPDSTPRTLADSLGDIFAGTIRGPWCYLEFGNVRWCEDPALLDSGLRTAALHSASSPAESRLSQEARANGELFLAFPVDGPVRNSFKGASSLLHIMCKSGDASTCSGTMAPEAEFRTGNGTVPRMIGVLGISAGVLGAVAMLGFVALGLLSSSITSMFLLLLAPAAVLAPALGDGGRAAFLGWATKLLGAVTSKLLYSLLLGVLFLMQRTLLSLQLGWWTQWLLLSAFWWGAFVKRHQLLSLIYTRDRQSLALNLRRTRLRGSTAVAGAALWARGKIDAPARDTEVLTQRRAAPATALPMSRSSPATALPMSRSSPASPRADFDHPRDGDPSGVEGEQNLEGEDEPTPDSAFMSSPVLVDAREVETGKKRYLGYASKS